MRGHSAMGTQPHEPWMFGPEVEAISREYIELRYRLLPTLYKLFQEAAATRASRASWCSTKSSRNSPQRSPRPQRVKTSVVSVISVVNH
jgi:hypothetical protein